MKILFIVPGSGDSFYCGNCFRDNLQANALRDAGHEVVIMPLYLPLKDQSFQADTPLFFPATSYFLSQKYFKKRSLPRLLDKAVNSDFMLNIAASFSGSTTSEGLESMTLSMIYGDDQAFRQQSDNLIDWMKKYERPDIVHLSSTLVIGIAKAIKKEIDIPIVCSLQDEEVWIDKLEKKYADIAWRGILESVQYIDHFVTTSDCYKRMIINRFHQINDVGSGCPEVDAATSSKFIKWDAIISVVYAGVDIAKYACKEYPSAPVIGFFYRMNEENGLGILVDAFISLKQKGGFDNLRLRIGGGYTSSDKKFLNKIRKKLMPYKATVDWCETYGLSEHTNFYKEITAICVPLTFDESIGLYLCEAFAAGRPAIEPATGSFREIVGDAGIIYETNTSDSLANAIELLLTDKILHAQCREEALLLSATRYNKKTLADELCKIYGQCTMHN